MIHACTIFPKTCAHAHRATGQAQADARSVNNYKRSGKDWKRFSRVYVAGDKGVIAQTLIAGILAQRLQRRAGPKESGKISSRLRRQGQREAIVRVPLRPTSRSGDHDNQTNQAETIPRTDPVSMT